MPSWLRARSTEAFSAEGVRAGLWRRITTMTDWNRKFMTEPMMGGPHPAATARRTLERAASANLAEQEELAEWLAEQDDVLARARDHLARLKAERSNLLGVLEMLSS